MKAPGLTWELHSILSGYVYLTKNADRMHGVQLGRLKQFSGTVSFDLPAGVNPDDYDRVAYELMEVSRVRVAKAGEISVLDIIRARTEVKEGDFILPIDEHGYDSTFIPHAMDNVPQNLRVLATSNRLYGVGQYEVVTLSGGKRQGVESGDVFSVFRPGQKVQDRVGYRYGSFSKDSKVTLPDEYHAQVMVFRCFDDISYAMVMTAGDLVREYDKLRHPSERL